MKGGWSLPFLFLWILWLNGPVYQKDLSRTVEKVHSHWWRTKFSMFLDVWSLGFWAQLFLWDFDSRTVPMSFGWITFLLFINITKLPYLIFALVAQNWIDWLFRPQNNVSQLQTLLCWIIIGRVFPTDWHLCSTLCISHLLVRHHLLGDIEEILLKGEDLCSCTAGVRVLGFSEKFSCAIVVLLSVNLADKNNDSHQASYKSFDWLYISVFFL